MNWLIRNMLVYVVFAAIVIFQSDIRRALAHFGQAPFFRYFNRAGGGRRDDRRGRRRRRRCWRRRRSGAIIVIEREIGLRNYIESGIPLDADADLRPARHDLPAGLAAARRRRDPPGGSRRGGRLLPAADRESAAEPRAGHAPPRRDRADRGERRRGGRRVGGDRQDLAGAERPDRARADGRRAARAAARADHAAARPRPVQATTSSRESPSMSSATATAMTDDATNDYDSMAYHPFRHLGLEDRRDRAGDAALADRGRRARRRAEHARAARVPEHPDGARDRRRSAGDGGRAAARIVGTPEPARSRRGRRGPRSRPRRGPGRACFTSAPTRSARRIGVEVAQVVPGTLALELEKSARRIVPVVPPLEGEPAPGFVVGRITTRPGHGRDSSGPRAACGSSRKRRPSRSR